MRCASEMILVCMMYRRSLIKIGSGVQKLLRGYTYTDTVISQAYSFFQSNESKLTTQEL